VCGGSRSRGQRVRLSWVENLNFQRRRKKLAFQDREEPVHRRRGWMDTTSVGDPPHLPSVAGVEGSTAGRFQRALT
jgi:hypothetical protein